MKIGLLADIHSNASALAAVLTSARKAQVDSLLIAGDLVGYYFDPKSVLRMIQSYEKPIYLVRGNHEDMLRKAKDCHFKLDEIGAKYGPGIQIALDQLTDSEVEWITSLPHPLVIRHLDFPILLCHGSPFGIDEYVYPDGNLEDMLLSLHEPPRLLIMGHTHYPFVRSVHDCLVVNPGSVGQPRNRVPGAHWALLDTQTMNVDILVEAYDISVLQQRCIEVAPHHNYLRDVLSRT